MNTPFLLFLPKNKERRKKDLTKKISATESVSDLTERILYPTRIIFTRHDRIVALDLEKIMSSLQGWDAML